jgi:hypothetical protein
MRLAPARDLAFAAKPSDDNSRVLLRVGSFKFTASRTEAIQFAAAIVAAVDHLSLPEVTTP